jgi:ABC-type glycerol-3-phosphate transport system substrate-binding protein
MEEKDMLKRNQVGLIFFTLIIAAAFVFTGCKKSNLKGARILIARWSNAYNVNTYVPQTEEEALTLEYRKKLLADNDLWIEDIELCDWDDYFEMVPNLIMSGSKEYSIYCLPADVAMILYGQGLLYPLSDSKNFPNNRVSVIGKKASWQPMVEELMTINGKCYGVMFGSTGDSWQGNYLFFNKRLFKEAGLDDDLPFKMQKDGTWTWDNFLKICKQLTRDIDNDGVIDIYAMPSDDIREVMYGFVYGNNGNFVTKDSNGKLHNATNTPEFIEALQFYQTLVNEGVVKVAREGVDFWGWNWGEFMDGRVAMVFDPEWRQVEAPEMLDDYGMVLAPKGPRAANYRTSLTEVVFCVPSYFTPDEVDIILEAFEKWVIPVNDTEWQTGYYPYHRDRRSVDETMALQRQVAVYRDFAIVPGYPIYMVEQRWWETGNAAQAVESWAPWIEEALEDYNNM